MKKFRLMLVVFVTLFFNSTLFATVYEDGSSGDWKVHDNNPVGADFNRTNDAVRGTVVELIGNGTKNALKLGDNAGRENAWGNETEFNLRWSMNFTERYAIYVRIQTTKDEYRYLKYSPVDGDIGKKGSSKYFRFGLGSDSTDGNWHTFTRDLQKDLTFADAQLTIKSVNMFLVRGSGKLDDIELFANQDEGEEEGEDTNTTVINSTIYEDAETGDTSGWKITDSKPAGATIANVYDAEKSSQVIELNGTIKNAFLLGNYAGRDGAWGNESKFNLQWSMKVYERYAIYVRVQTDKGYRYLKYSNSDEDFLKRTDRSKYIHHGLDKNITSVGSGWNTFTRDLQQDLKDAEPDNNLLSVNAFKFRGNGRFDDIMLFSISNGTDTGENNDTTDTNSTEHAALSGIIANYRFDECSLDASVNDQTGNLNAISYGAASHAGHLNNGAIFEGANDYIQIPTIDGGLTEGITISAWVDFGAFANFERIVELSNGTNVDDGYGNVDRYLSLHTENGKLRFQSKVGGVNAASGPLVDIPETGMHYYVATYDHVSGEAKIYIDNELQATENWDKSKFDPDAVRDYNYIGRTVWGDDYPFNGLIDELKIFNRALSLEEISTIYNNESVGKNYDGADREAVDCSNVVVSSPTPIAEYKFDVSSWNDNQVIDSRNDLNGIAKGGASIGDGKVNEGVSFDGVDDYIDMGNVLSPGAVDKLTISMWFKSDNDGSASEKVIFSKENIYMAEVYNGYFRYAISPHWYFIGGDTFPVTAGEWTHAVITYDGEKQKLYKNGILVNEREQVGSIGSNNEPFTIGAFRRIQEQAHAYFKGNIDEVNVFNVVLTPEEVKDMYDSEK